MATTARIHYQKGYDLGLELLNQYKSKNPDVIWEWHIAGPTEDEEFNKLREKLNNSLIKNQVYFWGNQNPEAFLSDKHLYISFSRWEGLPLAPIEAFIMGVPCLLSKVTGHGDLFKELKSFSSFDLNNYDSFETKLKQILSDYEFYSQDTKSCHEKAIKIFSIPEMARKTCHLYT